MSTALITGITGQDGAYLAAFLLKKGYKVIGLVRNSNYNPYNLKYLKIENDVILEECDLSDMSNVINMILQYEPTEIYNLAAQSSVGASFKQPISTLHFNIMSVLNILEAIRLTNSNIRFYQASSSEMYGKVEKLPIKINTPMHPISPYAISKATAHWTVVNYREAYNIFSCSGILFNHESYLRGNNFFVKKVINTALKMRTDEDLILHLGNLSLKRDFGYAPKYVEAMWLMLQQQSPLDYIICSGKSVLLEDVVRYVFQKLEVDFTRIKIDNSLLRPTDIYDIYGDNTLAKDVLGWNYDLDFNDVLDILIDESIRAEQF